MNAFWTDCECVANITQNANKQSVKYPHTPTKCVANNPLGVGADSSRPYPNITKYTYSFHKIHTFTLLNMYLCIIKYAYPFHKIRVFVSPHTHFRPSFCGCIHICGHDKSGPYSCWRTAITLLTDYKKHTFGFLKHHSYKTQTIVAQNANSIFSYYLKPNNNS